MKKTLYIFLTLLSASTIVYGQESTKSIIADINSRKVGQGNVRVMQDETIDSKLAKFVVNSDTSSVIRLSNNRVNGFKIQVFAGNNQNQSRSEAEARQRQIRQNFPQHQAEVSYNSPSWRLRVGNFLTRSEAEETLAEMKKTFPSFGREMHVVRDVIRKPLHR